MSGAGVKRSQGEMKLGAEPAPRKRLSCLEEGPLALDEEGEGSPGKKGEEPISWGGRRVRRWSGRRRKEGGVSSGREEVALLRGRKGGEGSSVLPKGGLKTQYPPRLPQHAGGGRGPRLKGKTFSCGRGGMEDSPPSPEGGTFFVSEIGGGEGTGRGMLFFLWGRVQYLLF